MVGAMRVTRIRVTDADKLKVGEEMGWFNLGSTIVMLVEAKNVEEWKVGVGSRVSYGDPIFEYVK